MVENKIRQIRALKLENDRFEYHREQIDKRIIGLINLKDCDQKEIRDQFKMKNYYTDKFFNNAWKISEIEELIDKNILEKLTYSFLVLQKSS
ncbi:MAG: hypothetical protein ACK4ND_10470 [Cytophagaceae bacterium]